MTKFHWTEEAVEYLQELFESGASATKSAAAMNERFGSAISKNSIIGKWDRLGWSNTRKRGQVICRRARKPIAPQDLAKPTANRIKRAAPAIREPQPIGIPVSGRFSLTDLGPFDCRFPLGDPLHSEFSFCGAPKRMGSAYCAEHHAICYQPNKFRDGWDKIIARQARRAA